MDDRSFRWLVACVAAVIIFLTVACGVAYVTHPDQWCNAMQGSADCLDKDNK